MYLRVWNDDLIKQGRTLLDPRIRWIAIEQRIFFLMGRHVIWVGSKWVRELDWLCR